MLFKFHGCLENWADMFITWYLYSVCTMGLPSLDSLLDPLHSKIELNHEMK